LFFAFSRVYLRLADRLAVQETQATEIYVIWYVFSFFFVLFFFLSVYAAGNNKGLQDVLGQSGQPIFAIAYDYLTKPAKPPPMAGRKQEVRQLRE
jgi:hypothetical protein